jgi:hypothetical protein
MMCWADSRHICIKFCTLRDAFKDARQDSGDSNWILRKQNNRGRVARIIHLAKVSDHILSFIENHILDDIEGVKRPMFVKHHSLLGPNVTVLLREVHRQGLQYSLMRL